MSLVREFQSLGAEKVKRSVTVKLGIHSNLVPCTMILLANAIDLMGSG